MSSGGASGEENLSAVEPVVGEHVLAGLDDGLVHLELLGLGLGGGLGELGLVVVVGVGKTCALRERLLGKGNVSPRAFGTCSSRPAC